MRRAVVLAFVATMAACGGGAARLWAPLPPATTGAQAVLFVLEAEGGTIVFASDAVDGRPADLVSFDLSDDEAAGVTELVAYAYAEDLDALGLRPGRQPPRAGTSCALEAPQAAFRTALPSAGAEWRAAPTELPATVRDALMGNQPCLLEDLCVQFVAHTIEIEGATQMRTLTALDDAVLLVDGAGRFYTVTATGATRREDLEHLPERYVTRAPDGELWFGGTGGRLMKGPLEGPYTSFDVGTSTRAPRIASLTLTGTST